MLDQNLNVTSFNQFFLISWLIMHFNSQVLAEPSICGGEENLDPSQVLILQDYVSLVSLSILHDHFHLSIENMLDLIVIQALHYQLCFKNSSCKQASGWYISSNLNHWETIQHLEFQTQHFHTMESMLDLIV